MKSKNTKIVIVITAAIAVIAIIIAMNMPFASIIGGDVPRANQNTNVSPESTSPSENIISAPEATEGF